MSRVTRDQPLALQRHSTRKSAMTAQRIEQVITYIQTRMPPQHQTFATTQILNVARQLFPGWTLNRSTLTRNPTVRQQLARVKDDSKPQPDFRAYANWTPPEMTSARRRRRRFTTLQHWSRQQLAEHLVGLEELLRHVTTRRQALEREDLTNGPWPENQPYPRPPFKVSSDAVERYERHRRLQNRRELARQILTLEQEAMEHLSHVLVLDLHHMQRSKVR